jgi:GNAT superfamily N-acetyltransferase
MLSIRSATVKDAALLATMILELAEYEHLAHEAAVTPESVARDGFGPKPKFRAVIAELDGKPAGYAVFFEFYSTFQARAGLFLDDIYVRPPLRKQGIGQAILAHVAKIAWDEKYFCMRWEVLDWNKPAIDFYNRLGAVFLDEWKAVMLIGDSLESVASSAERASGQDARPE